MSSRLLRVPTVVAGWSSTDGQPVLHPELTTKVTSKPNKTGRDAALQVEKRSGCKLLEVPATAGTSRTPCRPGTGRAYFCISISLF